MIEMAEMTRKPVRPEFLSHYDGLRRGTISFPICENCHRFHWYPMPRCPHCGSQAITWRDVKGDGELYSWTVVRHAFAPDLRDRLPYVVALVTFPDAPGVRLITNIVNTGLDDIEIGMKVRPVFQLEHAEPPQVQFQAA